MRGVSNVRRLVYLVTLCVSALAIESLVLGVFPVHRVAPFAGFGAVAIAVWWLGVAGHELAHYCVARRHGVELTEIAIGPLLIANEQSTLSIRRHRPAITAAGLTRIAARLRFPDGAGRPFAFAVAAGPVASLIWSVAMMLFATRLPLGPTWLTLGIIAGAMVQFAATALELVPIPREGISTDGSRVLTAFRNRGAIESGPAFGAWLSAIGSDVSPGGWPEEIVETQEALLADPAARSGDELDLALVAGYLLYLHYADRHDWLEANHVITSTVELPRGNTHMRRQDRFAMIDIVYAIHLGLRGKNALGAQSSFNRLRAKSPWRRGSLAHGAQAAIAIAAGDPESASHFAAQAKRLLTGAAESAGMTRLLNAWWDEVLATTQRPLRPLPVSPADPPLLGGVIVPFPALPAEPALPLDLFAWDPGVASDYRTLWIWRRRSAAELDLSA